MRTFSHRSVRILMVGIVGLLSAAITMFGSSAGAQSRSIGRAESFAILAGATVTDTGPSVITGDLGVFPGTAVTGNPQVNGEIHAGDAVAGGAQTDARAMHTTLGALPCSQTLPGIVGDVTLTAGVYCFTSDALFTGALTLDFEGNPDAEFIFKIGTTLTTASGGVVALTNAPNPCNVFWQVGSSATLGTNSVFVGTILADQSITAATGASVTGRLLALVGQVSLDNNTAWRPTCATSPTTTVAGPTTTVAGPTTTVAGPTTTVAGPTTTVAGPTTTVAGPTTTVAGPTTTVARPTTTVAGPTTTVAGPTTTVAGPTTTVAGPTTTVAGPTSTVAGPTTTVAGPTSTVAGPTSTVAGPTTTVAGPTTTVAGPAMTTTTARTLHAATVTPPVTPTPAGRSSVPLPHTGSDPKVLVAVGLLALVLGSHLLVWSRRSVSTRRAISTPR